MGDTKQHEIHTQQWLQERSQLHDEIQQAKAAVGQSSVSVPTSHQELGGNVAIEHTTPTHDKPVTPPFSQTTCGMNLTLSNEGYRASRTRGCRQSVAIGSAPLVRQAWGWFFEVVIEETVAGWVGGLGIGVTRTAPGQLLSLPDKAWRMPGTFIVGYWGCVFIEGKESRVRWRSDTLNVGSRVGVLVTCDGNWDLIVFVDDEPVVRVESGLSQGNGKQFSNELHDSLYAVVDVFAATKSITLSKSASPPMPPWDADAQMIPGSPLCTEESYLPKDTALNGGNEANSDHHG